MVADVASLQSFEEFMFEEHSTCKYDHIEVFDGGSSDATSLGIFCGSDVLPNLQSSSNQLFLTMLTDASVDRRGFKAFYSSGTSFVSFNKIKLYCFMLLL